MTIVIATCSAPVKTHEEVPFSTLLGKRFIKITEIHGDPDVWTHWNVDEHDRIEFVSEDGETYLLSHDQECGEEVYIESVVGDLSDLVGMEILKAEEVISDDKSVPAPSSEDPECEYMTTYTWSFYKLASAKGYVDIRFFGHSNGYYSESAQLFKVIN